MNTQDSTGNPPYSFLPRPTVATQEIEHRLPVAVEHAVSVQHADDPGQQWATCDRRTDTAAILCTTTRYVSDNDAHDPGKLTAVYRRFVQCLNERRWNDLGEFVDDELFNNETHEPR